MSEQAIARRYASALIDVVSKTGDTETIKSELKTWEEMINSNVDLKSALANPSIAHAKKEGVLEGLLQRTKPSQTTANFLRVLLQNSRLGNLSDINRSFDTVMDERSGNVTGEVRSAHELNQQQRDQIRENLESVTGKRVKLDFIIDKELIGGVVARIGSTVYDGSVRTQLEKFREELMNR